MHLSTPPSTPRLQPTVQTTLGWSIRWTPASQYSREHSTGVDGTKRAVKLNAHACSHSIGQQAVLL